MRGQDRRGLIVRVLALVGSALAALAVLSFGAISQAVGP